MVTIFTILDQLIVIANLWNLWAHCSNGWTHGVGIYQGRYNDLIVILASYQINLPQLGNRHSIQVALYVPHTCCDGWNCKWLNIWDNPFQTNWGLIVFEELQSHDLPNYSLETFANSITLSTWKVRWSKSKNIIFTSLYLVPSL